MRQPPQRLPGSRDATRVRPTPPPGSPGPAPAASAVHPNLGASPTRARSAGGRRRRTHEPAGLEIPPRACNAERTPCRASSCRSFSSGSRPPPGTRRIGSARSGYRLATTSATARWPAPQPARNSLAAAGEGSPRRSRAPGKRALRSGRRGCPSRPPAPQRRRSLSDVRTGVKRRNHPSHHPVHCNRSALIPDMHRRIIWRARACSAFSEEMREGAWRPSTRPAPSRLDACPRTRIPSNLRPSCLRLSRINGRRVLLMPSDRSAHQRPPAWPPDPRRRPSYPL